MYAVKVKAPEVTTWFSMTLFFSDVFGDCGLVWWSFWCMAVTPVPPMSTLWDNKVAHPFCKKRPI